MTLVMQIRPDVVMRTGVIEPFPPTQAVNYARNEINPFINSIRPSGPSVTAPPSANQIAEVARAVAAQFAKGKGARVTIGGVTVDLKPGQDAPGIFGQVVQAATHLAMGKPVQVSAQGQTVVALPPRGA